MCHCAPVFRIHRTASSTRRVTSTSPSGSITLTNFGRALNINLAAAADSGALRWRLLTVRTGKPDMTGNEINTALEADPWQLFFPSERDRGATVIPDQQGDDTMKPRDALLQIIEISGWHRVIKKA